MKQMSHFTVWSYSSRFSRVKGVLTRNCVILLFRNVTLLSLTRYMKPGFLIECTYKNFYLDVIKCIFFTCLTSYLYFLFYNYLEFCFNLEKSVSSVQSLSRVRLFATPWFAARQASLSITNSRSSLRLTSSSQWCHPAISSSVVPFSSCPQSLPASETFPMNQLFSWVSNIKFLVQFSRSVKSDFATPGHPVHH